MCFVIIIMRATVLRFDIKGVKVIDWRALASRYEPRNVANQASFVVYLNLQRNRHPTTFALGKTFGSL